MEIADERYIRDSILKPRDKIAAGYEPLMPSYEGKISEDELIKITAYIKSLGEQDGYAAMSNGAQLSHRGQQRCGRGFSPPTTSASPYFIFAGITLFFFIGGAAATLDPART